MSNFNDDALLKGQHALQKIDDLMSKADNVVHRWLRLRKKTIDHMKSSLLHIAELYALDIITLESAMQSVQSYLGMTVHCKAHTVRRWIEDHIVFVRGGIPAAEGEIVYEYVSQRDQLAARSSPEEALYHCTA